MKIWSQYLFQRDAINLLISYPGDYETLRDKEQAVAKICNKATQNVIGFFLDQYDNHLEQIGNNIVEFKRG